MTDNRRGALSSPLGWRTCVAAILVIAVEAWLTTQKAWHHATRHHEAIAAIAVALAVVVVWGVLCNVFRRRQPQNGRRDSYAGTASGWERVR